MKDTRKFKRGDRVATTDGRVETVVTPGCAPNADDSNVLADMTSTSVNADFFGPEDIPQADPEVVQSAYVGILSRHFALLRVESDLGISSKHLEKE